MTCNEILRREGKPYPRTCADCGLGPCKQDISLIIRQRDAWRAACRLLYEILGTDSGHGLPRDCINSGDWGRVIAMIGRAEHLEESSQ